MREKRLLFMTIIAWLNYRLSKIHYYAIMIVIIIIFIFLDTKIICSLLFLLLTISIYIYKYIHIFLLIYNFLPAILVTNIKHFSLSVLKDTVFKDIVFIVMKSINMPCADKWNLIVGEPPFACCRKII